MFDRTDPRFRFKFLAAEVLKLAALTHRLSSPDVEWTKTDMRVYLGTIARLLDELSYLLEHVTYQGGRLVITQGSRM